MEKLDFHSLDIGDRQRVEHYTLRGEGQSCDLSFANMFGWSHLYGTELAEMDGCLIVRFRADGRLAYMSPILPERDDVLFCRGLDAIRRDALQWNEPYLIILDSERQRDLLVLHCGRDYELKTERDYSDYLYLRRILQELPGKHLQGKRNHVNRFKAKYPDFTYEKLEKKDLEECLDLTRRWKAKKLVDSVRRECSDEYSVIVRIMQNWDVLEMTGGCIRVGGVMAGFTYGTPVNHSTFDVCVEKGDIRFDGVYAVLCQEFVRHLPERFEWINREEDMGLDGLRRSKESYCPERLIYKYVAEAV